MTVLVSDSSVLIDLERGVLLEACFSLSETLAVPDRLYERELRDYNGPQLCDMGLQVLSLDADGVALAQRYVQAHRGVSVPDAFALALAKTGGHTLLTGDGVLRGAAESNDVDCHGVLWLLDRLEQEGICDSRALTAALSAIGNHPRCRLPKRQVTERLVRYARQTAETAGFVLPQGDDATNPDLVAVAADELEPE